MSDARPLGERISLESCRDPGFTPGARDVDALLELWEVAQHSDPEQAQIVLRALARGDRGVGLELCRAWPDASAERRVAILWVLDRIGRRVELPERLPVLHEALGDANPRVRRQAARTVGKLEELEGAEFEAGLLAVVQNSPLPEQRAAIEALGRVGGPAVLEWLRAFECGDRELARRQAKAIALLERRHARTGASHVRLDTRLPRSSLVRLRCRSGAGSTLVQQVGRWLPNVRVERSTTSELELQWDRPLEELYRVRSALDVGVVFSLPGAASLVERVVAGLQQPELVTALRAWSEGPVRFRLAWTTGGRRRATTWKIAQALAYSSAELINDSRDVSWTIEVDERRGQLLCLPRDADSRFSYRERDVPAATHPTIAALLAWAGRPRPGEIVWDPFCGSGSELIECTKLEPDLQLWGTDVDPEALDAARRNVERAGLGPDRVHLRRASALQFAPETGAAKVSLIVSNPPMGRRVMVGEQKVSAFLEDFLRHAVGQLSARGRIILLSPLRADTARCGRRLGLKVTDLDPIDMGGFTATPQVLCKPTRTGG